MRRGAAAAIAAMAAIGASPARAGRPMETDDPGILPGKACQVETWIKRFRDSTDAWLLPACNLFGDLEIAFGGSRTRENGGDVLSARLVQAKTSFRALQPDDWGFAATAGVTSYPNREAGNKAAGDPYVYAIASRSFAQDAWIVHVNLGAVHERDVAKATPIWAFGHEIRIAPRVQFLPEIYRLGRGRPYYQASLRYALVDTRVTLDASYGNRMSSGSTEHWFSIGIHAETLPLLP